MVNELRDLLHESAKNPPQDGVPTRDLLAAGKARVRRRRLGAMAGGVAVVLVAAGVPFGLSRLGFGNDGGAEPAGNLEPIGKVVSLRDAKPAVEGKHYEVVATIDNENLDRENGTYFRAMVAGGVLVSEGPRTIKNKTRWGLMSLDDGQVDWLPGIDRDDGPDRYLGQTESGRLVFAQMYGQETFSVWTVHTEDEVWEQVQLNPPVAVNTGNFWTLVLGDDDRLYLALDVRGNAQRFRLMSTSLDAPGEWVEEGKVGDFTVTEDKLIYTGTTNQPDSKIYVRDLATGEERTFDSQAGARCNQLSLSHSGNLLVSRQYCGTHKGVRDDRVQVFELHGAPVVTIKDDDLELVDQTDKFLVLQAYGRAKAGFYAYEIATGKLSRLSQGHVKFCCLTASSGRTLGWSEPLNGDKGARLVLGRLD